MFSINPKSIKYHETGRGVAFSADLLEDGNVIGTVRNAGTGGMTFVDLKNGFGTPEHKRLEEEAKPHDGMEWYLEHLMDVAEKVIILDDHRK